MPLSKCFPCLQKNEEITKLDYSNNILTDLFPPLVWEHERTLEELHISSTRINNLPPQLFYCQGLKILQANNNNIEIIPESFGTLRQLQQLNLSRNYISNVPDTIKSCKHLTHLDLSFNTLQRIPEAITSLISLQELLLNETYLEFLPANFGRLINLRIVELRLNNLISLPKSMQRLSNLQRLDIGGNEFTKMPEVVGELKQLREFWFDFNQIRDVPPFVGRLRELQHFEANGNFINSLPAEISNWHHLEVISISTNELSTFPFSFGNLKSLVTFKCESNEVTELPDSISNLESLEELVISHNKLRRFPNTIGLLRKLRYIFADNNELRQLPEEICSCSNLSVLSVSRNKISEIPSNIGHLRQLKVLNIVQNHIATLPVSVLSLVNLTSLWISNNQAQPLVPLQYVDPLRKTHLTCFMLPQLGSKQKMSHSAHPEKEYNSIGRTHTTPANNCVSPTRRICFAEETTILNTNQTLPTASKIVVEAKTSTTKEVIPINTISTVPSTSPPSFSVPPNTYGGTTQTRENVSFVPAAAKDFLMRSPTPYPKELRLMAKYLRRNPHKQFGETFSSDPDIQEAKIIASPMYADSRQEFLEFVPSSQSATYVTNYALHHAPEESDQVILHQHLSAATWQQPVEDEHLQSVIIPNGHIYYENNQNHQCSVPLYQHSPLPAQEYYQAMASQPQEEIYIHSNLTSQQSQMSPSANSNGLLDPPPYHIARSFTKKTQEDLSNYDVIRKKQQHEINQTTGETDYQNNLGTEQDSEKDHTTSISIIDTAENTHEVKPNIVNKMLRENNNTTEVSKPVPHNIQNYKSKAPGKSRTPWLFGAHRNPTVKQISLKWEQQRGFEVDTLPNKEGIFIISTTPETEASRVLCIHDKLLDVDGYDFTSISVNEAHQVLNNNTGNVTNIMLSRR